MVAVVVLVVDVVGEAASLLVLLVSVLLSVLVLASVEVVLVAVTGSVELVLVADSLLLVLVLVVVVASPPGALGGLPFGAGGAGGDGAGGGAGGPGAAFDTSGGGGTGSLLHGAGCPAREAGANRFFGSRAEQRRARDTVPRDARLCVRPVRSDAFAETLCRWAAPPPRPRRVFVAARPWAPRRRD